MKEIEFDFEAMAILAVDAEETHITFIGTRAEFEAYRKWYESINGPGMDLHIVDDQAMVIKAVEEATK